MISEAMQFWLLLPVLAIVAFVQNMAFTWVSRSRNGGDVSYHRKAAYLSNGVWYTTQLIIYGAVWSTLTSGNLWQLGVVGIVYVLATSEGSCVMMRRLIRTETGKRRVGSY